MSSRGQRYRACGYLDLNLQSFYRYSVTCDLGEGHLALGKVSNSSILSGEVTAIQEFVHIHLTTARVYHRLLKSGTVYSTSMYARSKIRCDSIFCFKRDGCKEFGIAKHYVSFCTVCCISGVGSHPCQHIDVVTPFEEINWQNDIIEATARHIHCVRSSRYVNYMQDIVLMIYFIAKPKFSSQEIYVENVYTCHSPHQKTLI